MKKIIAIFLAVLLVVTTTSIVSATPVALSPSFANKETGTPNTHFVSVKFTDLSKGNIACWYWNFGDKKTSSIRNPIHKYTKPGKYWVYLKITDRDGAKDYAPNIITVYRGVDKKLHCY